MTMWTFQKNLEPSFYSKGMSLKNISSHTLLNNELMQWIEAPIWIGYCSSSRIDKSWKIVSWTINYCNSISKRQYMYIFIAIKLTKFNYVIVYFAFSVRDTIGFQDSITTRPLLYGLLNFCITIYATKNVSLYLCQKMQLVLIS